MVEVFDQRVGLLELGEPGLGGVDLRLDDGLLGSEHVALPALA